MTVDLAFGETIRIHRGATKDEFGDPVDPDTTINIDQCGVAPATGDDITDRDGTIVTWVVYVPETADIQPADLVELVEREPGTMWRIVGRPVAWKHPMTGWTPGLEVRLTTAEG